MTDRMATVQLVPPSVQDERGKAFGQTMALAISDPEFSKLLFERIDSVDASALPFLVREFSVEEFVEPGMSDKVIRDLLKASYELHASKGYISGVRRGLKLLGMRVIWRQWFQKVPKGQAGTHTATVFVGQSIFRGQSVLIDERVQRAALRMIAGMKRWSQHVSFEVAVSSHASMGAAAAAEPLAIAQPTAFAAPLTGLASRSGMAAAANSAQIVAARGRAASGRPVTFTAAIVPAIRALVLVSARMEASLS